MSDMYSVLWCESPDHADFVSVMPPDEDLYPQNFHAGHLFQPLDKVEWEDESLPKELPIQLELDPYYEGVFFELDFEPIPLMTRRLYAALIDAGVTNLQVFETVIYDPFGKKDNTDYLAWNLVGPVSALDISKSEFDTDVPERMISMDISHMVIDEEKAKGHLMFRLAESTNTILVHRKVRRAIEKAGIDTLVFIPADMWAS